MMETLLDGLGRVVIPTKKNILRALKMTDLVEIEDWDISISNFYSDSGDEVDVYDGRQIYDPQTIYEPHEVEEAVEEFLALLCDVESKDE
jgi:hypothetical protein